MTYRVIYTNPFLQEIEKHVDYLLAQGTAVNIITRWYDDLFDLLNSLNEMPKRFAVDPLLSKRIGFEIRKLNYGDYLIFYRIVEHKQHVELVHFQHGARERYSPAN